MRSHPGCGLQCTCQGNSLDDNGYRGFGYNVWITTNSKLLKVTYAVNYILFVDNIDRRGFTRGIPWHVVVPLPCMPW